MPATERVHSPTPEELMAFLDGETSALERTAIETHIVACAECRQVISDLGGVDRAMTAWQPENVPATLRPPRVVRASRWTPPAFSWRPGYSVIAFGGAVVTMALVVSLSTTVKRARAVKPEVVAAVPTLDKRAVVDGPIASLEQMDRPRKARSSRDMLRGSPPSSAPRPFASSRATSMRPAPASSRSSRKREGSSIRSP